MVIQCKSLANTWKAILSRGRCHTPNVTICTWMTLTESNYGPTAYTPTSSREHGRFNELANVPRFKERNTDTVQTSFKVIYVKLQMWNWKHTAVVVADHPMFNPLCWDLPRRCYRGWTHKQFFQCVTCCRVIAELCEICLSSWQIGILPA